MVMTYKVDIHQASRLGSAKKGVFHWIAQRVTAVALVPLGIWFVAIFILFLPAPYDQAYLWLSSPWVVTGTLLFIFTLFYHGYLGMQVIWEDYIPHELTRWALIMATKFVSVFLALLASVCILKINLS